MFVSRLLDQNLTTLTLPLCPENCSFSDFMILPGLAARILHTILQFDMEAFQKDASMLAEDGSELCRS